MGRFIDFTGQKFGRLTVLERTESRASRSGQRKTRWVCVCDCGNTIEVDAGNLKSGNTSSCGCVGKDKLSQRRTLDLTGEKIGRLTVEKLYDQSNHGANRWLCRCECGKKTIVEASALKRGIIKRKK